MKGREVERLRGGLPLDEVFSTGEKESEEQQQAFPLLRVRTDRTPNQRRMQDAEPNPDQNPVGAFLSS